MKILVYRGLDTAAIPGYAKPANYLAANDFRSADVNKIGDNLYVTRSPFLVQNARDLYYSSGDSNDEQNVEFLSFREYLESIHVPEGKEITPRVFAGWAARQRLPRELKDSHRLFEEFQGAITGSVTEQAYLSRGAYLDLGVRQSIYAPDIRGAVYDLFEKYLRFLAEQGWFDPNILSHAWMARVEPRYDFVVVDEVQDLTNIQLLLILRALRDARRFLLCGDSNQLVHPNFFSWAKVKGSVALADSPSVPVSCAGNG